MRHMLTKITRAYDFFLQAERENRVIQDSEIQAATGYTQGTAHIYIHKKWWWFLSPCPGGGYRVQGLCSCSFEEFLDLHRQKRAPLRQDSLYSSAERLTISFPPHLASWLRSYALQERRSVHEVVIELIEQAFQNRGPGLPPH
ncbi:MAG: hypothetical protein IRZ31_14735 [Thermogemmatispora sp.]|uniref:hypothetical protein n=1 Tax=Thermogemmatispora sp. TaxID=1968838 RepID=UPI00260E43AB|nr:hypothetical protein [Thermogemmatispora sp.]MBX5458149.1 hypothetical protein [Thermogemmatispora sp.]